MMCVNGRVLLFKFILNEICFCFTDIVNEICLCFTDIVQTLVLLDIEPDETMLNEGVAREVINRVQKLRKKVCSCPCLMTCFVLLLIFHEVVCSFIY